MCFREPVGGANRQQAPLNYSLELSGGTTSAFRFSVIMDRVQARYGNEVKENACAPARQIFN